MLERREFLKKAAVGAAGAGAVGACAGTDAGPQADSGEAAGPEVSWTLQSSFPQSLDLLHGAADYLAGRVSAMTGGRFSIRVFSAGEIVPGLEVMDAVQQGSLDAGYTAGYYYIGKNPALAFDSTVPFGLDPRQQIAWMHHGGGLELLREIYSDFGIVNFACGSTGGQMGGWFREPVESVSELRGIRMRIPGLGGEIMARLGVTVQTIAGGDIYPALERGAIDATEWVGPYDDEKLGFHEIAKNYYYPGWWEPGLTGVLQVRRQAFDELPERYREILESATRETTTWMLSSYDARNPPALRRLVEQHGVTVRAYSEDVLEAAWAESRAYLEEQAASDEAFRRVYESWSDFRVQAFEYSGGNELTFSRFAFPRG